MANRRLSPEELRSAIALLDDVRAKIRVLGGGDAELEFAYRRKVFKELSYDERDKPAVRSRLKAQKRAEQKGVCPLCKNALPDKYCVLDRFHAAAGYTADNTRLICQPCDTETQRSRGYA